MKIKFKETELLTQNNFQDILIKAVDNLDNYELSEYRFEREYQQAFIKYLENIVEQMVVGLSLKLDVNPLEIRKSYKFSMMTLLKTAEGQFSEESFLLKSLWKELRDKYTKALTNFKKFFSKFKPLQPMKISGKLIYNPETKDDLTFDEYRNIENGVMDYLKDTIGDPNEELIIRAGLFGILKKKMEDDDISKDRQKQMSYDDIYERYGDFVSDTNQAKKELIKEKQMKRAVDYARKHAAEYLSIEDGELKNKIVKMFKKQIVGGLEDGISKREMLSRLYWIDPSDELGKRFSEETINAWNRDLRRIAITEYSFATNEGYLAAVKDDAKRGEKLYFVYSGRYNPQEKPNEPCNIYLGKIGLMVDEPQDSDYSTDSNADYLIWSGKTNIGRKKADWWFCIPTHPHCFINPRIPVYTSQGYKAISRIEKGDLVLTHRGRFRKVTSTMQGTFEKYVTLTFDVKDNGIPLKMSVTRDHPFLTKRGWILASNLKKDDKIRLLIKRCSCGNIIPYTKSRRTVKFCSSVKCKTINCQKESYKKMKEKNWLNSKKVKKKVKKIMQSKEYKEKQRKSKMGVKNGMSKLNPNSVEARKHMSRIKKEFYLKHPEKHPNIIMSNKGYTTSIERKMMKELRRRKIKYKYQFPISGKFVDFLIKGTNLLVECDGVYWHNKYNDKKRDKILNKSGFDVLHFTDTEINKDIVGCVDEIERIVSNHKNKYEFDFVDIVSIEKKKRKSICNKTYNLSVEEDESYIVNGIVVHNCTHFWTRIYPEFQEWDPTTESIQLKEFGKSSKSEKLDLIKNDPIKKIKKFEGLSIAVEWEKGEIREYPGSPYKNLMRYDYGYLKNTDSPDGEEIDICLNKPIKQKKIIYMLVQKLDNKFDELKFGIGFSTPTEFKNAYIKTMTKGMFGGIIPMTLKKFKEEMKFYFRNKKLRKSKEAYVDNIEWNKDKAKEIKDNISSMVKKIKSYLDIKTPIIVRLYKEHKSEEVRSMHDEGIIIIYQASPDYMFDFLHELGHFYYHYINLDNNKEINKKLKEIQKAIKESKEYNRIFDNEHTYSTEREIFANLFKWCISGKFVDIAYTEVLKQYCPIGYELLNDLKEREYAGVNK